jgi:hypothetical protein
VLQQNVNSGHFVGGDSQDKIDASSFANSLPVTPPGPEILRLLETREPGALEDTRIPFISARHELEDEDTLPPN